MAQCVYCGFETRMYEHGDPVCMGCAGRLDAGEKLIRKETSENPDEKVSSTES